MNRDTKRKILYETLTILGVIALLTFICRLWALLLLVILIAIITTVRLLVLSFKKGQDESSVNAAPMQTIIPTECDVIDTAYSVIIDRINFIVRQNYIDAKWVWEKPNAKSMILNGEDVFIILNKAGGYKRAKVKIKNLMVIGIEFESVETEIKSEVMQEVAEVSEVVAETQDGSSVNYELVAFEWVENNILDLNKRCNEILGSGKNELILSTDDLPVKESWENICSELKRAGLKNAECIPEGIKIKF